MRKALYALLALILASGAYIFASTVIFPDVPGLPRLPQDPGTIGYVLKNFFRDDGTALNSEALGGISANEYLKKRTCTDAGEVWKGIGPDGYPICGPKGAGTLAQLGTIRDVTGTVKLNGSPAVVGMVVHQGDTITTDNASYTSVTFTDDASLLRLDQNTSVEMVAGNGTSLAQVIVNNGILWGRVLTTDGVDFGAGGYIAGVRGTSISVKKTGTTVEIAVIDSTNTQAATITNMNDGAKPSITVDAGSKVVESSGSTLPPTEEGGVSKATLLAESEWIRKNTVEDIAYLNTLSGSISLTPEQNTRVINEGIVTEPSPTQSLPLCTSGKRFWKGQKDVGEVCQDEKVLFEFSNNGSEKFTTPSGEKKRGETGAGGTLYVFADANNEKLEEKEILIKIGTVTSGTWGQAKMKINGKDIYGIETGKQISLKFTQDILLRDIMFVGISSLTIEKFDGCSTGTEKWDNLKDTGNNICQDSNIVGLANYIGSDKNLYIKNSSTPFALNSFWYRNLPLNNGSYLVSIQGGGTLVNMDIYATSHEIDDENPSIKLVGKDGNVKSENSINGINVINNTITSIRITK